MEELQKMLPKLVRKETLPEIPWKIRAGAGILGKHVKMKYLWNYYKEESEGRIPLYLPYIYMREIIDIMRRCAAIPRRQQKMVLIDGGDQRTEYVLHEMLEEVHSLTIITDRKEYFENLQECAFQELGLIIELLLPWEEKQPEGNLVWDFSEKLQSYDCYPKGSICFLPHKKPWKIREIMVNVDDLTVLAFTGVKKGEITLPANLAESLWIPRNLAFRKSRCRELEKWCKAAFGEVKISLGKCAGNLEKP